ncbi:putative disease resistance protein RGA1 [Triticum urartu]|nr:putative disease resistance protein RGA1 [Triticum urartu]
MEYEQESIMRNPEIRAIGGCEDVTGATHGNHLRRLNIREKGSAHTLGIRDIMVGIAGVPSGISEFVNVFQWARSAISPEWGDTREERFQDDICRMQSGLEFLRYTLPAMHDLIDRAEWRSHKDCVAKLLPYLKDAVYDAEDLLDDLKWYNHKVIVEGNESKLSITEFFRNFSKVNDIHKRLVDISESLEKMGLGEVTPRFDKTVRPETTSFCNETKIFGRDVLLKKMMRLLNVPTKSSVGSKRKWKPSADGASTSNQVSNESRLPDLPVLPLVGIGGIGKTTLAQHICSHPTVKSHFKTIIWICVSDDFDVKRLTKEAIGSSPGKNATTDNLNSLQHVLSGILSNERFLIVLDDMWDDALKEHGLRWKTFCAPFKNVLQGSMMLVTTRSQKVAELVHTMEPITLEELKGDVFWDFFKVCVFGSGSFDDYPELEPIGKDILPKLKGSPLAAKTLGRMLQSDLHISHWNSILDSELWALDQEATDIVPALRLSYMYLPFHLKRCFSFCAVYPKDKEFEKDNLAEIWAAEGFVKRQGVIPVQDTGCQYFNALLNLSFFQKVQGKYVIHDLLHDMAQKVSEDDCFIVKKKDDFRRIPPNVRHLSVLSSNDIDNSDLSILCRHKKLRTLLCDKPLANKKTTAGLLEDWCTELLHMRVIVFASLRELPASIGKLKHLQYLKISRACSVTSLPGTICMLHNLQVLCVKKCKLERLPSGFSMLVNLWRFESQGFKYGPNMKRFIETYGVDFDVADDNQRLGFRLIKNMKQLRGHLVISNIHKLSKNHSAEAELWNKGYLDKLTLEWGRSSLVSQSGDNENGIEVLRHLQPPAGVKFLVLQYYPGVSLPSWFQPQSLSGLTSASFSWCRGLEIPTVPIDINSGSMGFSSLTELIIRQCDSLSSLEQLLDPTSLPVINKIAIRNCENLISVPTEKFKEFRCIEIFKVAACGKINSQSLAARSLKKLKLGSQGMPWENDCGNLTEANIQCCSLTYFFLSCRRLRSIQLQMWNLPALQELHISGCQSLTSIGQPGQIFTNLTSLTISDCSQLSTIDGLLAEEYLPAIESITIQSCYKLSTTTMHGRRFRSFSSLKNLKVSQCPIIDWGGFELPSSLQSLHLEACGDISSFIPSGLENLQSLVSLRLLECRYRISISGHLWSTTLLSLQELEIRNCPELVSIGRADDISEIQNVLIQACKKLRGIKQHVRRGSFLISKK